MIYLPNWRYFKILISVGNGCLKKLLNILFSYVEFRPSPGRNDWFWYLIKKWLWNLFDKNNLNIYEFFWWRAMIIDSTRCDVFFYIRSFLGYDSIPWSLWRGSAQAVSCDCYPNLRNPSIFLQGHAPLFRGHTPEGVFTDDTPQNESTSRYKYLFVDI